MISLNVNGKAVQVDANPEMPLLWVLRDLLDLTGTKFGCGRALCGACTVHIEGEAARSCSIMAGDVRDRKIVTIEAVNGAVAKAVIAAWQKLDVVQCGYCQSGQIMSAITLLTANKAPTDEDIDLGMEGNICRCGTYVRIKAAIHEAASALK
ncbi:(2Fe-2S)-binding protein [Burkholderia ambifaria]|uniref:(2Fe-2S)-binding protein n=1 Tax=Burkholderia ambifaria TaxID=152480 RepID=UPI00158A2E89|nr:(2Fe-2S)-binding protein [Burkholderia ambifaria]